MIKWSEMKSAAGKVCRQHDEPTISQADFILSVAVMILAMECLRSATDMKERRETVRDIIRLAGIEVDS